MEAKVERDAMRVLRGLGVSSGIGIGTIVRVNSSGRRVFRQPIDPARIDQEVHRLRVAIEIARGQLFEIKSKLEQALGQSQGYILDAHLLMLEDQRLLDEIESIIRTHLVNAEWAVNVATDRMLAIYAEIKDDYLRERGSDIEDVANRLITALSGNQPSRRLPEEAILVTEQILPSIMVEFNLEAVAGLAAKTGGQTSHAAIIARSLGIPAVVGLEEINGGLDAGRPAIIDGEHGMLIINPSEETLATYRQRRVDSDRLWCSVQERTQLPAETRDGVRITLRANIEMPSEAQTIHQYGAQGVGLFRTQYLFLASTPDLQSEERQFSAYRLLAETCGAEGVVIRTFDWAEPLGPMGEAEVEPNPAMGLRAIRFSLHAENAFRTQLRAILRAAFYGRVRVVLPMVSSITELRQSRRIIESVAKELKAKDMPHEAHIPVGVMIEIPAAVMIADVLAKEADFFSLGTNDLIQYLLAVDRDNTRVAYLYKAFHPAVLRALKQTVEAAAGHVPVEVCGEMASDPLHALVLIGLGLTRLSMAPKAIPFVKDIIRSIDSRSLERTVATALKMQSAEEVENLLAQQWKGIVPGLVKPKDLDVEE